MKAAVVSAVNAEWELADIPTPSPGPGEVLIRVRASGICHNDILVTRGVIPFPPFSPAVLGHEPAGEVVAVGPGVTNRRVGDRVGVPWIQGTCGHCDHCARNLPLSGLAAIRCAAPAMTGITVPGGQAEYLVARASGTVPLPDGLSFSDAAPTLCAGYTAWCAFRKADPRPFERVAVLGIGALGHFAVQFAATSGFETVAITRSDDKRELARELGASLVVGNGEELAAAGGADVIVATGSSNAAAADSMRGLRPGGRIVLAGMDPLEPFALPPDVSGLFFALDQKVLGVTHEDPRQLAEALEIVASGRVRPMVELFTAEQVADAAARVAKGEVRFTAVVSY